MDKDLLQARLNQAIDRIEAIFGDTSLEDKRPDKTRLELLGWVLDNKQLFEKATKRELATVTAILEACQRRRDSGN